MSYRLLDINLLPPELLPGPAVRYRVIIIWTLVLVTLFFLMLDSFLGITRISQKTETQKLLRAQIRNQSYIVEEYDSLKRVDDYVMQTGKLVSMASADYIDLPLAANRVASILPDGVFLERISNDRPAKGTSSSIVGIVLVASREDPSLVLETFNRFKRDPIFSECYMRVAQTEERSLGTLLKDSNIKWSINGPELGRDIIVNHYVFEIFTLVTSPIPDQEFKVVHDDSRFLADFERRMAEEDKLNGPAMSDNTETEDPYALPPGVSVEVTK